MEKAFGDFKGRQSETQLGEDVPAPEYPRYFGRFNGELALFQTRRAFHRCR